MIRTPVLTAPSVLRFSFKKHDRKKEDAVCVCQFFGEYFNRRLRPLFYYI